MLGGTGFIGRVVTQRFAANRRSIELMMLVHRTTPYRELEQVDTRTGSLATFDLSLLDRFQPDAIVHLARMGGRGRLGRWLAAWQGARANRRILRHLAAGDRRPQVFYVSGTLVYGDCGDAPVDEGRRLNPIAFAREYHRAERPWEDAMATAEIPVTILRPPWIIGGSSWFAEYYLKPIRQQGLVPLFGDGRNWMSLLDVDDCAGLIAHAVCHGRPGRSYNLFAPDACITQEAFAGRLAEVTGAKIRRFDSNEIDRRWGRAVREAFTFSNRSATRHPELMAGYTFRYRTVDEMILHHVPADLLIRHEASSGL